MINDGLIRTLDVNLTLTLDRKFEFTEASIVSSAKKLILQYFNVDNTDFGQSFHPQDLVKTILQEEPQIRFITVDNITEVIEPDFREIIQLNNFTIGTTYV